MTDLQRIDELTQELQNASDVYYNSGMEIMSNKEYDAKFDELKTLEERYCITDGFTSKVGAVTSSKLAKVKHEYEAKSLDKTKDVDELVGVHSDPKHAKVCQSWKLDGSTVQLTYENGKLVLAASRGDGRQGQDITANAKFVEGIPQTISYQGRLVVRGEALMSYAEFNRLNTDDTFANARNLANATITAENQDLLKERKVEFKAFELVHADNTDGKTFSEQLDYLGTLGFGVVPHEVVAVSDLKKNIAKWSEPDVIKNFGYPVDGLVVVNEDIDFTRNLKGTEHHPNRMKGMAFKWKDEEVETVLRDIEWQVGRTGVLTPVAVFDTVDLAGTKVTKASLHNYSYIQSKDLRIGDKITVYKANMIIPQVADNLDKDKDRPVMDLMPKECPCCKGKTKLNVLGDVKTVTCENEDCPAKELEKIVHFASKYGMNIEGLAENTIKVLMDNGFIEHTADIYYLKDNRDELIKLDGFAEKGVDNLLQAIENSRTTDFASFMYASGIEGFGRGQIKVLKNYLDKHYDELCKEYSGPDNYNLLKLVYQMELQDFDFTQIDGIGNVLASNLNNWFWANLFTNTSNTLEVLNNIKFTDAPVKTQGKDIFNGKSFCITGNLNTFTNRDECVAYIEANGGKFVSGVSKKTDYLVNNDTTSTSGKNKKAKELGIPVISESDLRDAVEKGVTLPEQQKPQIER